MSLEELYRATNGSLYAIERFSENPMFFRYRLLSRQEIRGFINPTYSNKERVQVLPLDVYSIYITQQILSQLITVLRDYQELIDKEADERRRKNEMSKS